MEVRRQAIRDAQREGLLRRVEQGGRRSREAAAVIVSDWEAGALAKGIVPGSNAWRMEMDRYAAELLGDR